MKFIIPFLLGLVIGKFITDKKWRNNADTYIRICSAGKLYKVLYDEEYEALEDNYP